MQVIKIDTVIKRTKNVALHFIKDCFKRVSDMKDKNNSDGSTVVV